ncbi:GNAT family N-acetyltransferase [Halosimplex pelagicum]|uniref:GNAT family N-acetyltransferase n=1 Tax=Halosimplex pelagicum TaxID=869886 RepID=A0A7D5T1U0_9EURY|nr:GNAT family N-acetyltransferase [Halosimplex pelagicum]QLH80671.1 GNAT family N-acetyltransferase [Halosimplex pelagicum]
MTDDAAAPAVRALSADRYDEFRRIVDYAFHPEEGPRTYDDEPERIADRYGAFVDDDLVSVCGHYDLRANLRGEWVRLAGLAAVATPPERRREGYVGALVDDALERWRGEYPLSALWPFSRSYYEQFGWATANTATTYTCPTEQLAFARGAAEGRARPVEPDEWRALRSVHESQAEATTLALKRRSETWWRERVLSEGGDDRPWAYVWERDGDVCGYLVYTFKDAGEGFGDRRLTVDDTAAADHEAWLGLLGFLADHDSQATEVRFAGDARTDLLDLVPDPDAVDCEVETGPMVRVVDVTDALEACPYPADASADCTLAVTDATADWNDGRFRLTVADGTGECERVDGASDGADAAAEADATLDVGTLSQLVVGYHDVAAARRVGGLSVAEGSVADTLATLFPSERVYLRTFF